MTLNYLNKCACAASCIILSVASEAWPTNFNFIPIDVPGATTTLANDINDRGQIVGSFLDGNGLPHGFLDRHGTLTTIDFPRASRTSLSGINNRGAIVGDYFIPGQSGTIPPQNNAFLDNRGTFTVIERPGGQDRGPIVHGINEQGQMVGEVDTGQIRPFLRDPGGRITMIDVPGSIGPITRAFDINATGQIVGSFSRVSSLGIVDSGFLLDAHGSITTIDVPGARQTQALGISNRGEIVGEFVDVNNRTHGFLNINGHFITVDVPGSQWTSVTGINNAGLFVGSFMDASFRVHGFVDPPTEAPEPGSLFLLISGLGGLALLRKRLKLYHNGARIGAVK